MLLVSPPSPERIGSPLLGMQYLAASLLAAGHEVRVIDAAARLFPHDADWIADQARRFGPDLIGAGLFTRWVRDAYQLAARLRGCAPVLVAGGAHATVRPDEALTRGFDVAVLGEGERAIVALAEGVPPAEIPGVRFRRSDGSAASGPAREFVGDLDALPFPHAAQELFDPLWYDEAGGTRVPGGVLSSRGCPGRCTFCANQVTGRGPRHRSVPNVMAEIRELRDRYGVSSIAFWDETLTADRTRAAALFEALESEPPFCWTALTRVNAITRDLVRAMRRGGCMALDFGVESGDPGMLRTMRKGISAVQVVRALEWARAEGIITTCSFMLGFPGETPEQLGRTLRFIQRVAPMVDWFSTFGVVVPFPGTPIYENYHERYGFTRWWLRDEYLRYEAPPSIEHACFYRYYTGDPNLEADFFHYSDEMKALIRECLRLKGEHNLRAMGWSRRALSPPTPEAA